MSIRKIRNSWWVDFRFNRIRYRKRSPENSRAGAQTYESLLRQKLLKGESPEDKKQKEEELPSFKEFAWKWFETYAKPNNKASEISNKEIALRMYLVPFFGKTMINKITNLQIEEYKAQMVKMKKIKNKTINNHLTALSKCLRCAMEWEAIDRVPKIKKLKPEPFKFDFLTVEESKQLLNHASGIWHDVFLVLLKTGMRKGELLALTWENINWQRQQIIVSQSMYARVISSTKSNRIRYIDMTKEVYKCLWDRKKEKGFVFADDEEKHFSMRRINDELTKLCKKAGIRKTNVHALRHTFASHLAMAGAPIQAVQGLLGHSDIQTTMRYAHLSPSIFRDTINLLEPKAQNYNFGQHMGNKADLASAFEKILKANNLDNSANTKQKQSLSELSL